jgi:hypothetical protein
MARAEDNTIFYSVNDYEFRYSYSGHVGDSA